MEHYKKQQAGPLSAKLFSTPSSVMLRASLQGPDGDLRSKVVAAGVWRVW